MSTDYYAGCKKCECFRSLGVHRAHGFFIDQEDGGDPRNTVIDFMVNHSECNGLCVGVLDLVPDHWRDEDPDAQGEL